MSFIYPTIDPKSRTVTIRIDVNNRSGKLKPEMFANVEIEGNSLGTFPLVPENSIIRSGMKNIIIIALGEGKFKPQEVQLGGYADGYYQVLSGVSEGIHIVTSAQFLIDSESNLRSAIGQMQESETQDTTMQDMKNDSENNEMKMQDKLNKPEMKEIPEKQNEKLSSVVRNEPVDILSIDKNMDGKVYQDMMDWNVISDEPGECPLCGMTLKEVTLDEAKKNLVENNFKVK